MIAGYFGCGNLGDDAILLGFLEGIKDLPHQVTLLSGAPEETYRNYKVPSVPRRDQKLCADAIQKCDALVFAGGSIFQDVSSIGSPMYYGGLIKKAKDLGKKVILLSQGVGPLNNLVGRTVSTQAFNRADIIAVRDPASVALLRKLGVKTRIELTADLAFLIPPPLARSEPNSFGVGSMRTVGLAPRPFGKKNDVVLLFGELARLLYKGNMMPVFMEMDRNEDGPLIREIAKQHGGKMPDLTRLQTPMDVQQRMMRMDSLLAMRLHAGILATTVGVPPFMLSYDPKVTAFAKLLQLHEAPVMENVNAQRVFDQFMKFQQDREKNVRVLEFQRAELMKLAEKNIEVLEMALGARSAKK
ncbi:MAG: polysaccharide pyruvyl transferase CsaB [Armatimonadetes bacterium]|nr:polysaccharide pyruvyl transferase CsaB [Armatimonadota bacterium]